MNSQPESNAATSTPPASEITDATHSVRREALIGRPPARGDVTAMATTGTADAVPNASSFRHSAHGPLVMVRRLTAIPIPTRVHANRVDTTIPTARPTSINLTAIAASAPR